MWRCRSYLLLVLLLFLYRGICYGPLLPNGVGSGQSVVRIMNMKKHEVEIYPATVARRKQCEYEKLPSFIAGKGSAKKLAVTSNFRIIFVSDVPDVPGRYLGCFGCYCVSDRLRN